MSAFDIDEQGQARVDEFANSNLLRDAAPEPAGAFNNLDTALGEGFMRGGARAAQAIGILAEPFIRADIESRLGKSVPELTDPYFKAVDEVATNAVDHWTPKPGEVGKVGEVLGGFSEIALPLMVTAGNPSLLIGQSATGTGIDLVREGVDAKTAAAAGILQGTATAVGFKLPFLGKTLATKMASGALGNTVVNTATTAAQREVLKAGGYEELAKNYDAFDLEARAVDVLTGVAFGGIDHLASRPLSPSDVAAIAAAGNAKHYQLDTAPGRPANVRDSVAHQEAMEAGLNAILTGEPVAAPPEVTRAEFIPRPETAPVEIPAELVALDETRAADKVKSEAAAEAAGYDVAEGELTDEQLAAFQGLRSHVQADEVVRGSVEGEPRAQGNEDAGGPGGEPLRVYRGGRGGPLTPEHFETETLGAATGHPSSGLGVFFSHAESDAARYGTVSEHFLDIRNPKVIAVEDLPGFDSLADANAFRKKLEAEGHDGMVIDASHLGGPVNYVAFAHGQVKSRAKKATKRPPPQKQEGEPPPPDVVAAQAHLAAADIMVPTGELDADGAPVARSARELMAESQAEIAQAEADAVGYEAAVNCILSRGTDAT